MAASTGVPALKSYATRQPNGTLSLVVVNTDSANIYTLSPSFAGFVPASGTVKILRT
ncbi:MAG: hypothetical protein ACR2GA_02770 [Chloroflexota bacterium]